MPGDWLDKEMGALSEREQREQAIQHTLIDVDTGAAVTGELTDDIVDRVHAGKLIIPPDEKVRVRLPSGEVRHLAGDLAQRLISDGQATLIGVTGERRAGHEETLEQTYGDKPLLSGALGFLSSATLGAFDVGARLLGQEEAVREVSERSPIANIAGQAGGFIVPGAAAKLPGAVGKTIAKLPAAALTGYAERITAKGVGKGFAAKTAIRTGAGAAEGLGIAIAGGTRETMLSDDPVTAEAWVANIGSHAQYAVPIGGAITGGVSLVGSGVSKFMQKGGKILDDFKAGKDITVKSSEVAKEIKAYEKMREPGYMAVHGKESAKFTGTGKTLERAVDDPQFLKSTTGLQRQLRIEGKAIEDTIANPEAVAAAHAADDVATLAKLKAARPQELVAAKVKTDVVATKPADVYEMKELTKLHVSEGLPPPNVDDVIRDIVKNQRSLPRYQDPRQRIAFADDRIVAQRWRELFPDRAIRNKRASVTDLTHSELDEFVAALTKKGAAKGPVPSVDLPPKIDKAYKKANRARYEAEEGGIEGAKKRFNRERQAYRRAVKKADKPTDRMTYPEFNKANMKRLMKSEGGHKGAMKKMGEEWKAFKKTPEFEKLAPKGAAAKVKKFKPLKIAKNSPEDRAIRNFFPKLGKKFGKKAVKLSETQLDEAIDAIESGALAAKRAEHTALLPEILAQNQALLATIEAVSAKGGTLAAQTAGLAKGYAATAALGILPGGFIGAGAALMAPRLLVKLKTAVMEPLAAAGGKAATRMSGAVESVASAGKLAARASRPGATKILESVAYAPKAVARAADRAVAPTKSPLLAAFRERELELRSVTLPGPDGLPQMTAQAREMVAKQLAPIAAVDPQLADQMETVSARKVEYLTSILPMRPGAMALQLGPDTWRPSEMDLRSFARSAAAVEDPISVFERAAEGSVTPEDSEALRSVYPEMFERSKQEILAKVGELRETLPYSKRLALWFLFGVPVDPSCAPEVINVLQRHFEEEPGTSQGTQPPQPAPAFGSVAKPQGTPSQERQAEG